MNINLDIDEVKLFLSESNRVREERFLRSITDNYKNKLIFSKNTCTDGNLVQVFPNHPFIGNKEAIRNTEKDLGVEYLFVNNTWLLLKTYTRSGICHESFHILFTDFRTLEKMNFEFKNQHSYKAQIMHHIMNIIEDSFIELAGINYLNGLEFYIEFGNYIAYYNIPSIEKVEKKCENKEQPWINLYLHWAMMYAIIGKTKGNVKNKRIIDKINQTQKYFDKGRIEKDCNKRFYYAKEVFKIVEDLVDEAIKEQNIFDFNYFKNKLLPKLKEVNETEVDIKKDFDSRNSCSSSFLKNKEESKSLNKNQNNNNKEKQNTNNKISSDDINDKNPNFSNDLNNNSNNDDIDKINKIRKKENDDLKKEQLDRLIKQLEKEKNEVEKDEVKREKTKKIEKELELKEKRQLEKIKYTQINSNIYIEVNKKFSFSNSSCAIYEELYRKNYGLITSFSKQLQRLIKNREESWENRLMIGTHLNTKRLADNKNRVWMKKNEKGEVSDLSISVLIDGSGSMYYKLPSVIETSIIFYEVAKKLNIPISIIEERAIYGEPKVVHNVLVDFKNYKKNSTKYNILRIDADEGTREGVSLKWTNEYQKMQSNKDRLMIILADGNPEHAYSKQNYTGKISASDTKTVAEQIQKQGTTIVAIALGESCYPYLKQIYRNTILCDNDLSKLPSQMLRVLKRNLFK